MTISKCIESTLAGAGKIVLEGFGKVTESTQKESQASVVTEVDLRAEQYIVEHIRAQFPHDTIIAEETGFSEGSTTGCWVIDPIDGTSNFVAGIPWFAIMISYLHNWEVQSAGILLPAMNEYYSAEKGQGAFCNGEKIEISKERALSNALISYGIDCSSPEQVRRELHLIGKIVQACRNLRSTNSAVDDCYVATGKFGAAVNQHSMIWDNTAGYLLVREAGGVYTDIEGNDLDFHSTKDNYQRNFTSLEASAPLHQELLQLIKIQP